MNKFANILKIYFRFFQLNEKFCKLSTFRESRVFAKPVLFEFYLLLLLFLGSAGDQGGGPPALIPEALLRDDGEESVESSCKIVPQKKHCSSSRINGRKKDGKFNKNS